MIMPLPQAMGRQEGMYVPLQPGKRPSRPQRNNNPGDLEYHAWQTQFGGVLADDPRFAKFPTVRDGYNAMIHLLGFPIYLGKTLRDVINVWAPAGENQPSLYLDNVLTWSGLSAATLVTAELLATPLLSHFTLGGVVYEL